MARRCGVRVPPGTSKTSKAIYDFAREILGGHVAIRARGAMRRSVGIETKGGKFTKLIERGSALPATCSFILTTADVNQTSIQIKVFRGDHDQAARNTSLGAYELAGIPPGRPGSPRSRSPSPWIRPRISWFRPKTSARAGSCKCTVSERQSVTRASASPPSRLARPVRAPDGRLIIAGWVAWRRLEGERCG